MRFLIDADLPRSTKEFLQRYGHTFRCACLPDRQAEYIQGQEEQANKASLQGTTPVKAWEFMCSQPISPSA